MRLFQPIRNRARGVLQPPRTLAMALSLAMLWSPGCAAGPSADRDVESSGDPRDAHNVHRPVGKADSPCGPFPSYYYEYLDDTFCRKRLPGNRDRDLVCPTVASAPEATVVDTGQQVLYRPASAPLEVDSDALVGWVPDELRVALILIRRVDGVPHYRYLSNGRHDEIVQPWSSTKFMAVANAAAALRWYSSGEVGLTAEVKAIPLGDLVSVIHSYDQRTFTSNGLARYFHNIGTRFWANQLIHGAWLQRPEAETFGGDYGDMEPALGYVFHDNTGNGDATLIVEPELEFSLPNQLSPLTMAEFLKRLVMHREDEATRMADLHWDDLRVLFYGAEESIWYAGDQPQGMESDTAIYVQQALDPDALEAQSQGQWRIFSKLGYGGSRGGELAHNAYACLPVLDAGGEPVPDVGKELVLSVHLSAHDAPSAADQRLATIYRTLLRAVQSGQIK